MYYSDVSYTQFDRVSSCGSLKIKNPSRGLGFQTVMIRFQVLVDIEIYADANKSVQGTWFISGSGLAFGTQKPITYLKNVFLFPPALLIV